MGESILWVEVEIDLTFSQHDRQVRAHTGVKRIDPSFSLTTLITDYKLPDRHLNSKTPKLCQVIVSD